MPKRRTTPPLSRVPRFLDRDLELRPGCGLRRPRSGTAGDPDAPRGVAGVRRRRSWFSAADATRTSRRPSRSPATTKPQNASCSPLVRRRPASMASSAVRWRGRKRGSARPRGDLDSGTRIAAEAADVTAFPSAVDVRSDRAPRRRSVRSVARRGRSPDRVARGRRRQSRRRNCHPCPRRDSQRPGRLDRAARLFAELGLALFGAEASLTRHGCTGSRVGERARSPLSSEDSNWRPGAKVSARPRWFGSKRYKT